ncbi:hypothetical protein KM043_001529 [Ampulex compressa]|nr:hypothetical protein KM043_001529 [Ampulex compressa]
MLEILMINVDRFVHTVLESMGLTKKLMFREKLDGVNALNVVRPLCIASELRLDLTRVSLNKRVVSLSKKLNFADEQNEHAATEGTTKLSKILSRSISASHSNTLMQDVDAKIIRRAVEARAKSKGEGRKKERER